MNIIYYTEQQLNKLAITILPKSLFNNYKYLALSDKKMFVTNFQEDTCKLVTPNNTHICFYCKDIIAAGDTCWTKSGKYWHYVHDPNFECPKCNSQTGFKLHHILSGGAELHQCSRCGYEQLYK